MKIKVLVFGHKSYLGHNILTNIQQILPHCELEVFTATREKHLKSSTEFYFDPINKNSYKNIPQDWDILFYLLSPNAKECETDPELAFNICVNPIRKIIETGKAKNSNSKFIYFSSIHVWGTPIPENNKLPPQPSSIYAKSHFSGENDLLSMGNQIRPYILRLGNVFGGNFPTNQRGKNLIGNYLLSNLSQSRDIHLNSSGDQYRNFVSINFFNHSVKTILELYPPGIHNIVWPSSIKIKEFCELTLKVLEQKTKNQHNVFYGKEQDPQGNAFTIVPTVNPLQSLQEYIAEELDNYIT